MKKTLSLLLLLIALCLPTVADTSREVTLQMTTMAGRALHLAAGEQPIELLTTDCYTVFTTPRKQGFAIVSSDSQRPQLLAYSATGSFSATTGNPGYLWWQKGMSKLSALGMPLAATTKPDPDKYPSSVAPLISSTWGQDEPYNYQCPMGDGTPWAGYLPGEGHCATGCVATALGQLMRYHRWPDHGEGSYTIHYPLLDNGGNDFTVDFGEACYDWDHMLDDYSGGNYTRQEAEAVSQLLYHCGVGSKMVYGTGSSGTVNLGAIEALEKYFRYDMSQARLIIRTELSEPEWMALVYEELAAGRPIFYEGLDINLGHWILGHSFLIDGYDEDGLVHVNWGWDGRENGYFNIALLDPLRYSFDEYQDMTIGIRPPQQVPEPSTAAAPTQAEGDLSATLYTLHGTAVNPRSILQPGIYARQGRKVVVRRTK